MKRDFFDLCEEDVEVNRSEHFAFITVRGFGSLRFSAYTLASALRLSLFWLDLDSVIFKTIDVRSSWLLN